MGSEQPASYYNSNYKASKKQSWHDYRGPRKKLYKAAAGYIAQSPLVIDLGCGPGHFAGFLDEEHPVDAYVGYDFSRVAIHQARELLMGNHSYDFNLADLTKMGIEPGQLIPPQAVFVIMETLEHIEDDYHILNLVPAGCQVVISVPQFDDPGHVRTFPEWEDVAARYSGQVEILEHQEVWKWFILKGVRKQHEKK